MDMDFSSNRNLDNWFFSIPIEALVRETYALNDANVSSEIYDENGVINTENLYANAVTLIKSKEAKHARDILKTLLTKSNFSKSKTLTALAETYIIDKNLTKAEELLRNSLCVEWNFYSLSLLARVLIQTERADEALKMLSAHSGSSLFEEKDEFFVRLLTGEIYTNLNRFSEAKIEFRLAYQLNPESYELQISVAKLAIKQKNNDLAIFHLREALSKDPYNQEASLLMAECLIEGNKLAEAIPSLENILVEDERNVKALLLITECALALNKTDIAFDYLEKYVKSSHKLNPSLMLKFCELLIDKGEFNEAYKELKRLIDKKPELSRARMLIQKLAEVFYERQGSQKGNYPI